MFQHYMAYGLLESRRPSEKVSQATASNLKKAVEKAMADAGLDATPGSAQLVAAITGEIQTSVSDAAVQQVLTQVASVVEKTVVETVQEVKSQSASSGGGNSDSGSSDNSGEDSENAQITLRATDLFGKIGEDGAIEKITSTNFTDYFDLSDPTAPTVKAGESDSAITLYVKYPTKLTSETIGGYVAVAAENSVALTDNTATYYVLDEGMLLSENKNVETFFQVDDEGNVTLQGSADIYTEDGTKIEAATNYATGTAATIELDDQKELFVKEKDAQADAAATKVENVATYFAVKNGVAALIQTKEGATFYDAASEGSSVDFKDYLTVTVATMEAVASAKVYQFETVDAETVLGYFAVNGGGNGVERSTAGADKVIATGSAGSYTVDDADSTGIAEFVAAGTMTFTKPVYKEEGGTTTALEESDLTAANFPTVDSKLTIKEGLTLYDGEIPAALNNDTVNSNIGNYLKIPGRN